MSISLDGRTFTTESNTENGEVDAQTRFAYHQDGNLVWAEYQGGAVVSGHLMGLIQSDGTLDMRYHHVNASGDVVAGTCRSTIGLEDGRVVLAESWQWFTGDQSRGESRVVEVVA